MGEIKLSVEALKDIYKTYLDMFWVLREREFAGLEALLEEDTARYVFLLEEVLLPLQRELFDRGEDDFLEAHAFSYEL